MSKTSMSNCFSINVVPLNPLKFSDDDINEIGKLTVPKKRMRSNPFEKVKVYLIISYVLSLFCLPLSNYQSHFVTTTQTPPPAFPLKNSVFLCNRGR